MASAFVDPDQFLAEVDTIMRFGAPDTSEELPLEDGRIVEREFIPLGSPGDNAGVVWAYRDITERATEARRLEASNQSLAALSELKNEFVAKVSHELRTPLTSVVSFVELMQDRSTGSLNPDQQQYLDIIDRNAHRLLRLIEDLLLMARLESQTLTMSPSALDGTALVRDVIEDLGPKAARAEVVVELLATDSIWLSGDRIRLEQVAANLLGNAINYTPAGGRVTVRSEVDGDDWLFEVADTGVGIPESELSRVFETFVRGASGAAGPQGTGLGLPISRLLVELHKGTLTASSRPGSGTVMSVRIPRGVS